MKQKRFCLRNAHDQKALLAEAGLRGFHVAVLDWPGKKSPEQQQLMAQQTADMLLPEVCCVHNALDYALLVNASWVAFYTTMPGVIGERLMAQAKMHVKPMREQDGLVFLRQLLSDNGMKEVLDDLYKRYQAGLEQQGH